MDETKKKPELNIRAGSVRAAVWKNQREGPNGQRFESVKVKLDRTYMDGNNDYKNTQYLDVNDIPKAIHVLWKAYSYLISQDNSADNEIIQEQTIAE